MTKWPWVINGLVSLLLLGGSVVEAGPLRITSESLEVEHVKNRAQFSGNVHLTRDDFELRCDRLVTLYKQQGAGELEQAEAYGHVTMQQGDKHGSSREAIFKQAEGLLILIGEAKVEDPKGVVEGEKIVHNIHTTETNVEQGVAGGRAHIIFDEEVDGSPGDKKP